MLDAERVVRTTLAIDDDVLIAAKAIAQQARSTGEVISALGRRALPRPMPENFRNGFPLLSGGPGVRVTLDMVNALRDEMP
jgi:hypothetical protein